MILRNNMDIITIKFPNLILVRIPRSHRKREKIERLLGYKPIYYFNFTTSSQFIYLNKENFDKIKFLGVTKSRFRDKIGRCWYFSERYAPTQPYDSP